MCRSPILVALILAAILASLAACGGQGGAPAQSAMRAATAAPAAASLPPASPARSATPRSGQVPPPIPDPAAVAAGAPLRARLLAQIDEYEREVCPTRPSSARCAVRAGREESGRFPELVAYWSWFNRVEQCYYDPSGRPPTGYIFSLTVLFPTPAELREPWRLDVYVSGTEWCGRRGPVPVSPSGR